MNNMITNCKVCGAEIAKSARKCPYCGAYRPPLVRNPVAYGMLCVGLVFVMIILIYLQIQSQIGGHESRSPASTDASASTTLGAESGNSPSSAGTIVYNEDEISVTYTGSSTSSYDIIEREFVFLVENTSSKTIDYSATDISVNGYMTTPTSGYLYGVQGTITPGDKANCRIMIAKSALEENSISDIEVMKLSLKFIDDDSYTLICETPLIQVLP